jgi:hypothetical protein
MKTKFYTKIFSMSPGCLQKTRVYRHGSLSTVFREQFAAAIPPKNEWILNSAVNCWLIKRQHV